MELEALPVHDGGAGLVVLLLGDPHLLEGGEGGKDGASDPDGVPANVQREAHQVLGLLSSNVIVGKCNILTFSLVGQLS